MATILAGRQVRQAVNVDQGFSNLPSQAGASCS